jgi:tRNA modification GTPase
LLEGNSVRISSTTGEGIDHLKKTIEQQILSGRTGASDLGIAVSERQAEALRQSISALNVSLEEFKQETGLELIAQQLRLGLNAVGEIVGKYSTEDILDKLFGTFCIGK